MRFTLILFLLLFLNSLSAQIRNPFNEEILPFGQNTELIQESGSFNHYQVNYGFVKHTKSKYALPFLTFCPDTSNSWIVVLNGGPGRSNIRFSFDIDSLLKQYNILLPGYRGIDDRALENIKDENDPAIKEFIAEHMAKYSTHNIADDIALIAEKLRLSPLTIVAHSYGTLVAGELYRHHPELVDSILAFSPVDPNRPMPNPEKIDYFISSVFDGDEHRIMAFKDTLESWFASKHSEKLAMGLVSAMYVKEDFSRLLSNVLNGTETREDVIEKSTNYLKKAYLIDFALKINSIKAPDDIPNTVYSFITNAFYKKISRYLITKNTKTNLQNFFYSAPASIFVPKYEFFYTQPLLKEKTVYCECGHADLWEQAPEFILGKTSKQ